MFGWIKRKKSDTTTDHDTEGASESSELKAPPKNSTLTLDPDAERGAMKASSTSGLTQGGSKDSISSPLKVKVKERKGCSATLAVEVPAPRVHVEIEAAFRRVQTRAKLPGFRPGKAPLDLVRKNFESIAWEDAVDSLLKDSIYEAFMAEKIVPVAGPSVSDVELKPGGPLRFEVKTECAPSVELKKYKGLALAKKREEVTAADIEKRLQEIREGHSRLVHTPGIIVEKNHFVEVDYESFLDGQPLKNGKAEHQLIDMSAPQNVQGFVEGLLGAKDGETRDISVQFPSEHPQKDLAGKTIVFKTVVTAIKEKVVPALDDEFAKDVGATDIADLNSRVRKEMESERKRFVREDLEKQIVEALLNENRFDVPAGQVDERTKELTEQMGKYLAGQGFSKTEWDAQSVKFLERNKPEAERQVRLSYILGTLLSKEKITVEDAEVDARIGKWVDATPEDKRANVNSWVEGRRDTIRTKMREEKLFEFLIGNAQVTEDSAPGGN